MDYQPEGITIIKDSEFLVMLAAAGIRNWYGIHLADDPVDQADETAFNKNLAALYRKELVEWNGPKAYIAEPYRQFFRVLKEADRCILIQLERRPGYIRGCYCCKDLIAVIERRTSSADELELSLTDFGEWILDLEAEGCFPLSAEYPADEAELPESREPVSSFELRSVPEGKLLHTMKMYEQGLFGFIETVSEDVTEKVPFSNDAAIRVLKTWIGGNA